MPKFTGLLRVEFSVDGRIQRLIDPLVWECGEKGSGRKVIVPAGHNANGLSAPWFLAWIFPRAGGRGDRPARLHDYLVNLILDGKPHEHVKTMTEAHEEFRLALIAVGFWPAIARVAWFFVSVYGLYQLWGRRV